MFVYKVVATRHRFSDLSDNPRADLTLDSGPYATEDEAWESVYALRESGIEGERRETPSGNVYYVGLPRVGGRGVTFSRS